MESKFTSKKNGKLYEEYINKFLRGKIVSKNIDFYDIETKTTLYEVKGIKLFNDTKKSNCSYGRYQIILENHYRLINESKLLNKKAKYVFLLKVRNTKIFKSLNWNMVNSLVINYGLLFKKNKNKKCCHISIKEVW